MSKYQELRDLFKEYEKSVEARIIQNVNFAVDLTDNLRDYLQVPDDQFVFETPVPFIRWYKVDIDGNELGKELDTPQHAVTTYTDGSFNFAFALAIERAPNSHPQIIYRFTCQCSRNKVGPGGNLGVIVKCAGVSLPFAFDGKAYSGLNTFADHIFEIVSKRLKQGPDSGKVRQQFGFNMFGDE